MTQSGRIPDTHAEAWALLPFLVNGRLTPEEREWVELHVQSCDECRREFDAQRPLARQMREAEVAFESAEQRAFAKLWTRIEASEGAMPVDEQAVSARATGTTPRRTVRWLAAAVVVQAIGLTLLGVTALNNSEEATGEFRTVTSAEVRLAGPAVRLMFTAETSMGDVTDILAKHGLELVRGPGSSGVFTAALADTAEGTTAESMAMMLRRDAHVQFAEPVTH
jgi:anti-sigma factor RsiW